VGRRELFQDHILGRYQSNIKFFSHGLSAASGKVGAIIAQVVFGPLRTKGAAPNAQGAAANPWINHIMQIFALFMLCGVFTSLLIPETARKTLEELAGEWDHDGNPIVDTTGERLPTHEEKVAEVDGESDGAGSAPKTTVT